MICLFANKKIQCLDGELLQREVLHLIFCKSWMVCLLSVTRAAGLASARTPPPTPEPSHPTCCVPEVIRVTTGVRETAEGLWSWRTTEVRTHSWAWSAGASGVPGQVCQEYMQRLQVCIYYLNYN